MIAPEELRKKLAGNYRKYLRDSITNDILFPFRPRVNLKLDYTNFSEASKQIRKLEDQSKEKRGYGYIIEYRTVGTKRHGSQTTPESLIFPTPEDLFSYIGKKKEAEEFFLAVDSTCKAFDLPDQWIRRNTALILQYLSVWPEIITAVRRLKTIDADTNLNSLNSRSLPITLDTKFIERNRTPIQRLLEGINANSLDLSSPILSSNLLAWIRFYKSPYSFYNADLGIFPVEKLAKMDIPAERIVVIENKASFLLPLPIGITPFSNIGKDETTLLIWGQGNACLGLKDVSWLQEKELFYWGDMDLDGLAILGRFRKLFPRVESMGMSLETYTRYSCFAVPGNIPPRGSWFDYLTAEEQELEKYLRQNPEKSRLEQERLSHEEAQDAANPTNR